jgi:hypothetical protein
MKSLTIIFFLLTINFAFGQKRKILSGHKTFTYLTVFADSINKVFITDTIKFVTTDVPWKVQPDKQHTVVWQYSKQKIHDSIRNKIFSIGWIEIDSTGAVESKKTYWTHPPRNNYYTITEIAPFPIVQFPCELGKKYGFALSIGEGWGAWSNITLKNYYEITNKISKTVNGNVYDSWVIKSQNDSQLGKSSLTTVFNEKLGFIEYNYSFYNKTTIRLDLINIE